MSIVSTQLTRSQKLQVSVGVPVGRFWPWIWTWDALPQSLFPACSHRSKKTLLWLCARSWKIRLKVTQTFSLRPSRATKVGAMHMTLRPNKLWANGRRPLYRDRKNQDKWGQMWKRCSSFFSMFEESYTGNSFLLDRLSIRNFTWRFWGDWERMCEENAQNCGYRVNGSDHPTAVSSKLTLSVWAIPNGSRYFFHVILKYNHTVLPRAEETLVIIYGVDARSRKWIGSAWVHCWRQSMSPVTSQGHHK